ncbi:MAG: SelB C-terminal domain-containing protein, partial [Acidobacteria bacterium]|nr:SelB C-terminal domain-containing protein [Acidobacteriota bacterium]
EPLLLLPGDRYIIRRFSPVVTIGGGIVLDSAPPRLRRPAMAARLKALQEADPIGRAAIFLADSPHGMSVKQLIARSGLVPAEAARAGAQLRLPEPWLIRRQQMQDLLERLRTTVAAFHKAHPLLPGMLLEELRSRLVPKAPAGLLNAVIEATGTLVAEADIVRSIAHLTALRQDEEQALEHMETLFRDAGLAAPSTQEVLAASGVDAVRARALLQMLLRRRRLVRISRELVFHPAALEALDHVIGQHQGETFSIATFKTWTGVSRKYAVPLLEYLDRRHLTRRQGDHRLVVPAQRPIG